MSRAPAAMRRPAEASLPANTLPVLQGYFEQSALPLTSLVFLTPLIILYEISIFISKSVDKQRVKAEKEWD